jgi:hypothetical protein
MREERRLMHGPKLLVEVWESRSDCEENQVDVINKPTLVCTAVIVRSDGFYGTRRGICTRGKTVHGGSELSRMR